MSSFSSRTVTSQRARDLTAVSFEPLHSEIVISFETARPMKTPGKTGVWFE